MSISALFVNREGDPEAMVLLERLRRLGFPKLRRVTIERVFRLEHNGKLDPKTIEPLMVNPLYESVSYVSQLNVDDGPIIEIGYQSAVTDPETVSILEATNAMSITSVYWARLSLRYQLKGVDPETAEKIVKLFLYNEVVQTIIPPDHTWTQLRPTGTPAPLQTVSLKDLGDDALLKLSYRYMWEATLSQLKILQQQEITQGRPFTQPEIEIILQSWCDHCYHTTWKSLGLFEKLHGATERINHPLVKSVFTDNAGGMIFYDGYVICIKGETHNHPSAIATYGGIATKHGGIIRDTLGFGKGAYPIGGSTIMGTMDPRTEASNVPKGALHPLVIVLESIRGTAYYCNPMGIPMMLPMYRTHHGYPKCFALGHSIGIIPEKDAIKDDPCPGDIALLVGGDTGRDGIHGCTLSSSGMSSEEIERSSTSVQIGLPITERCFMTAIPELRDAGCIRTITDLGAGGISCACGELGEKTGIEIYLDRVPLKDASLSEWEILISESQERMLIVIIPNKLDEAMEILERYNVASSPIGHFTDTQRYVVYHHEEKVVDIDMNFLWGECPIDPVTVEELSGTIEPTTVTQPSSAFEWEQAAENLLSHLHCCDQSAAGFQFDSTVQGCTAIGPFAGINGNMPTDVFVSVPLRGKPYGAVFTAAYNPFFGDCDPSGLGRLMIVEAIVKAVVLGVNPAEIVLCDNFYTPKLTPETGWGLKQLVESAVNFSELLGIPFVSGKDSSSGTFTATSGLKINVPYTFVCATLGRVPDVNVLITKPFKRPGNQLVLVGNVNPDRLGGSVYLSSCYQHVMTGCPFGTLPDYGPDWADELTTMWQHIHKIRHRPVFQAASAIGEGGLFRRLFEMSLGSGFGARVDLRVISDGRLDGILFGEHIGCMLFEIDGQHEPSKLFGNLPWRIIGHVTNEPTLTFTEGASHLFHARMNTLTKAWEQPFKEVVA